MFSFSPRQGLIEHVLVDILWDYGWKLCEKRKKEKKKWCFMKKTRWAKLPKKKRKEKEKKSVPLCSEFLNFCVDRAWNQKKLSIGA